MRGKYSSPNWLDGVPIGGLEHVIWVWVAPLRKYVQMVGFVEQSQLGDSMAAWQQRNG